MKTFVQASLDRWRAGTGSHFERLAPEADRIMSARPHCRRLTLTVRHSPEDMIQPFNAHGDAAGADRAGTYADGDILVTLFEPP